MTLAKLVRPSGRFVVSVSSGTSPEAQTLETLAAGLKASRERVISFGTLTTLSELAAAVEQAKSADWDGYGAKPVRPETIAAAKAFIAQLPAFVPPPSVTPEPDGELSLEWRPGPWRVFSVSVGPYGRLTFAGVYGSMSNIRGTELLGDLIPDTILNGLTRILQP